MSENYDDPYQWPQFVPNRIQASEPPETVLRYRQTYNGKLFPVHVVIGQATTSDRWASDDYHAHVEGEVITIVEKASGVIVKVYNSTRWLALWYECKTGTMNDWQRVIKLELVTKEEADAGQS